MKKEEAIEHGLALVNRSTIAMLGTNDNEGYPNIRALIKMGNEGLKKIWFSTNTSSKKVAQLQKSPKACIYFVDFDKWEGLMLIGIIDILQDPESKQQLWREGFEKYYPLGVNDPDYSVLCFTAKLGKYYHNLDIMLFEL
ncbi:MAG: pyridoxamine 5'-phosphate oxidase family protein [Exilispira sp.]|jgi:general stress protein 26|nr:pyridoxamine 5'-phosphate oxidase family protein [Exilispira sp.]